MPFSTAAPSTPEVTYCEVCLVSHVILNSVFSFLVLPSFDVTTDFPKSNA